MINNTEHKINDLRKQLYKKYNRSQLSDILKVSENHVSRLLNNQSEMTVYQYFVLMELIK